MVSLKHYNLPFDVVQKKTEEIVIAKGRKKYLFQMLQIFN